MEHQLPVFQPKTFKDEEVVAQLRQLAPQLIVVVAYGKILPKSVLEFRRLSCVNVHGSLLPKYRGAGPISGALSTENRRPALPPCLWGGRAGHWGHDPQKIHPYRGG